MDPSFVDIKTHVVLHTKLTAATWFAYRAMTDVLVKQLSEAFGQTLSPNAVRPGLCWPAET